MSKAIAYAFVGIFTITTGLYFYMDMILRSYFIT